MLEGWFFITATLLAISGGAKLRDPAPTQGALRAARLPASRPAVYALAIAEIAAGAFAIGTGHVLAALAVAVLYLGFAGFVLWALLADTPIQSCGCFGRSDTPPSPLHVLIDLSAALVGGVVAIRGGVFIADVLAAQPAMGFLYLGYLAVGTWLLALVLAELPALLRSSRTVVNP